MIRAVRALVRGAAGLLLLLAAAPAPAHGLRIDVRVELVPVAVPGLVVELHQDLFSPQLAVANRSGKLLEILDADGRPFLRIGPTQTEVDLASRAYHLSRVAGGGDVHPNTLSDRPRWTQAAREPAYGWFDPRIATATLEIPYAVRQLGQAMPFQAWRIPARLGGEPLELRGTFSYAPPPDGVVLASLRSPPSLAPGVSVQLLPGPVPAFFLRNRSGKTVSVLDGAGQPFLRVGPDGVWADTGSAAWRAASPTQQTSQAGWRQLSKADSVSWLEPRAAWTRPLPKPLPASGELNQWRVPLRVGAERQDLIGINRWLPRPAR